MKHSSIGHSYYPRCNDPAVRVGAGKEEAAEHSGHYTRCYPRGGGGRLVDVHHFDGQFCVNQGLAVGYAVHGIEGEAADGFVAA